MSNLNYKLIIDIITLVKIIRNMTENNDCNAYLNIMSVI